MTIAQLYKITYLPDNIVYYGSVWSDGKTIFDRFEEHLSGKGSIYIAQFINAGVPQSDFRIDLLMIGELEYVLEMEAKIARDNLWPRGLNGNAGSHIVHTDEVRSKMSHARRGRRITSEHKAAISRANKSRPTSDEKRRKISQAHTGRVMTEAHRRNLSLALSGKPGKPRSEATRAKMSASHKARFAALRKNK
ncbi:MAG: hypothetical protein H9535_00545 [Ignavibacteria bacterium]|nr:hypothetical protein [Ignavibacteria bacterium]